MQKFDDLASVFQNTTQQKPDEQLILLCRVDKMYELPIEKVAAAYKWMLLHGDYGEDYRLLRSGMSDLYGADFIERMEEKYGK